MRAVSEGSCSARDGFVQAATLQFRPVLGSVAGQFGEVLDYKGNHSERILPFNPSINPISAGGAAADDSLIPSRH